MTQTSTKVPFIVTRKWALANGFNYEGRHFGARIFAQYDENNPEEMGAVVTKYRPMEAWITLCLHAFMLLNAFRPEGEEVGFPFLIRPIPTTAGIQA